MRFHMGVSFNLRKLKKFFIPFLIGLLSYFGIAMLGFINVHATTQEGLYYSLDNTDVYLYDQLDNVYFGSTTLREVLLDLDEMTLSNTDYAIGFEVSQGNNAITKLVIFAFPKSADFKLNIYSNSNFRNVYFGFILGNVANNNRVFSISNYYNPNVDLFDTSFYTTMKSCFDSLSSCPTSAPTESTYSGTLSINRTSNSATSTSVNVIYQGSSDSNIYAKNTFIYYDSTKDLILDIGSGSTTYYYRDVFFNGSQLTNGNVFPTYKSYREVNNGGGDNTDSDVVNLEGLSQYVYWFFNPQNRNDVLVNLYVIIFLYSIGYFTLKFISCIYNVKWKNRR